MKPRTVVTAVLLLFVTVSAAYFVFNEVARRDEPPRAADAPGVDPSAAAKTDAGNKVIVYYFHATRRCLTCKTIEAYSEEAIKSGFAEDLESGSMEWRAVNVDEPENKHFIDDFQLATKTVVLVHVVGGANREWKKLDRVWELVQNKPAFIDYILDNTNEFLADAHG
jgi:hypothetical protein